MQKRDVTGEILECIVPIGAMLLFVVLVVISINSLVKEENKRTEAIRSIPLDISSNEIKVSDLKDGQSAFVKPDSIVILNNDNCVVDSNASIHDKKQPDDIKITKNSYNNFKIFLGDTKYKWKISKEYPKNFSMITDVEKEVELEK